MATHGDHPSLPDHLESLLMEDVHTVFLKADCPPRVKRGAIGSLKLVEAESSVAIGTPLRSNNSRKTWSPWWKSTAIAAIVFWKSTGKVAE